MPSRITIGERMEEKVNKKMKIGFVTYASKKKKKTFYAA